MSNLRAMYIIWYRDLLNFWRNKGRLFASFIMPFLFLVIFGTGLSSSMFLRGGGTQGEGLNYIQFLFPGIVAMIVLFTAIMWGVSVVWDREFGFLKEVLVAPISRTAVAIGKTLGGATIATIQGMVMLIFVPFVGVSLSPGQVLLLIALMFIFACSVTAMGIFIASRIRTMETFQVVMQLLLFPMFFLSPALFPVQNLPSWLGALVRINPVSYGVDSFRQSILEPTVAMSDFGMSLFGHTMSIPEDILLVALFGIVMVFLAVRSFSTQE